MMTAIEFLDYELKGIERRLEEEKLLTVKCAERLKNHNLSVEHYESMINDYNEALRVIREASE